MSTIDIAKIYSELLNLKIDLNYDDSPTPSYIQEHTFECNEHNRKLEKMYLAVTQELSGKKRLYSVEKFNFECKKRQALTNNEKIKKIPTGKEREAAVEELYENELRAILDLENDVNSLQDLLKGIINVQNNLKATASDIRMLERTMEQQINRLNIGTKEDPEVAHLHQTLAELDEFEKEMTQDDVESVTEVNSDESGDESQSGARIEVTLDGDGQGESGKTEASDDSLSSFLVDDSEDPTTKDTEDELRGEGDDDDDDDGIDLEATIITEAVLAVDTDDVSTKKEPDKVPTEDAPKKETPKTELDLSEIGIDIDMGDISESPPPPAEKKESPPTKKASSAPPTVQNVPEESSKKKTTSAKKEGTPTAAATDPKRVDIPSKEVSDIDFDDILNSLD